MTRRAEDLAASDGARGGDHTTRRPVVVEARAALRVPQPVSKGETSDIPDTLLGSWGFPANVAHTTKGTNKQRGERRVSSFEIYDFHMQPPVGEGKTFTLLPCAGAHRVAVHRGAPAHPEARARDVTALTVHSRSLLAS